MCDSQSAAHAAAAVNTPKVASAPKTIFLRRDKAFSFANCSFGFLWGVWLVLCEFARALLGHYRTAGAVRSSNIRPSGHPSTDCPLWICRRAPRECYDTAHTNMHGTKPACPRGERAGAEDRRGSYVIVRTVYPPHHIRAVSRRGGARARRGHPRHRQGGHAEAALSRRGGRRLRVGRPHAGPGRPAYPFGELGHARHRA